MSHIYLSINTHTHICVCMYARMYTTHLYIATHIYLDMLSSIVLIKGCQQIVYPLNTCIDTSLKCPSPHRRNWEKDSSRLYQHQMTAAPHCFICVEKHQDYLHHFLTLSSVSYLLTYISLALLFDVRQTESFQFIMGNTVSQFLVSVHSIKIMMLYTGLYHRMDMASQQVFFQWQRNIIANKNQYKECCI